MRDPLCGFTFTNNGFINLFKLLISSYSRKGWNLRSPELPILPHSGG